MAANPVTISLESLASCLCGLISERDVPDVCFCGVIPGEAASVTYSGDCSKKCGMAWVRMLGLYPASGVGVLNTQVGNCGSGIGFDVEVGMMRCTPIGVAEKGPTGAELLAATQLQVADMLIMREAIACCDEWKDWILNAYTPLGPSGGMLGGAWSVQVWSP